MKIFDQFNNWTAPKVTEAIGWLGGCEILSLGLATFYERGLHLFEVVAYPIIGWIALFFVRRQFYKWFPKEKHDDK